MADASLPQLRLRLARLCVTDLPNEILNQIIHQLQRDRFRDSAYLASLCKICRRFRDIVEPHLYHSLTLGVENEGQGLVQSAYGGVPIFSSIVGYPELRRTLTQRPALTTLVRVLSITTSPVYESYHPLFIEHHLPILRLFEMLEEVHLSPPPMFSDLPGMPALKFLHLDFSPVYDYFRAKTPAMDKQKAKLDILAKSLRIPTLQKLMIQDLLYDPITSSQLSFQPDNLESSVAELHLFSCEDACTKLLKDIVRFLKSLRSFIIDHQWRPGRYGIREPNLSGIDHALAPHQDSLEELMIGASCGATLKTTVPIDSLINFTTLKRLAIPEHFLIPSDGREASLHDLLPSSLCELQLEHCMEDVEADLGLPKRLKRYTSLAENRHASLPALERVICWYHQPPVILRYPGKTLSSAVAQNLAVRFKNVGVRFEWGTTSCFLSTPFGTELNVPFYDSMAENHKWNGNDFAYENMAYGRTGRLVWA